MSPTALPCPGCQNELQVLRLETAEVDYCLFCGGAYFDRGEIETLLHHPLPLTESGRPAERACPRCETLMSAANLGTVPVDRCGSCAGLYLDTAELAPASRRLLEEGAALSTDSAAQLKRYTTTCVGCGETFGPDRLTATTRGLACAPCHADATRGAGIPLTRPGPPPEPGVVSEVAGYAVADGLVYLVDFLLT